jgi:hypothetical protein
LLIGFSAVLFELDWLKNYGFGWPLVIVGFSLLALNFLVRLTQTKTPDIPRTASQPSKESRAADAPIEDSARPLASSKSISFVAPVRSADTAGPSPSEAILKTLTPEILNIRFLVYRCEVSEQSLRAIYQNATQRELKWFEIASITIRQMPNQEPWEGKLILDIVPNAMPNEKVKPIRISSTTFVNYSALPQGQSASTRENLRRLASYALSRHRLIFLDPGTDYFVHVGQPPVRFISMAQFTEYDSRY